MIKNKSILSTEHGAAGAGKKTAQDVLMQIQCLSCHINVFFPGRLRRPLTLPSGDDSRHHLTSGAAERGHCNARTGSLLPQQQHKYFVCSDIIVFCAPRLRTLSGKKCRRQLLNFAARSIELGTESAIRMHSNSQTSQSLPDKKGPFD